MASGCIFTARGQIEIVIFISHCGGAVFVAKAQNESPAPQERPQYGARHARVRPLQNLCYARGGGVC